MQVLAFCVLNSQYIHSALAPWCLRAGVLAYAKAPFEISVVEGTINEPPEHVLSRVLQSGARIIGFSCYIWNIRQTLRLAERIKAQKPDAVIVLGGPEAGYNACNLLSRHPAVDFIITGEGERPMAQLCDALSMQEEFSGIPGLTFRAGRAIVCNLSRKYTDDPPTPYCAEYFAALSGRMAYLETSRGCPFSCAFCLSGRLGGVRFFDEERAEKELMLLAHSGARTIKLVDRTFNANPARAYRLFCFLIEQDRREQLPVCFHFELAGDLLDDAALALLKTARPGLFRFEIGLQSFFAPALESVHRKTNIPRLKRNIVRLMAMGNIHLHIDLIAGLPGETLHELKNSINLACLLFPHEVQLGFLKLLHGAPMRENRGDYPCVYENDPPYTVLQTPWLSTGELARMHRIARAVDRFYNSGYFRRTFLFLVCACNYIPYELFDCLADIGGKTLDDYTENVYFALCSLKRVPPRALRDVMVEDRFAKGVSGLPACLRVEDRALKQVRTRLAARFGTRPGVKRSVAIQYTRGCVLWCDRERKDPVRGEYALHRIGLPELLDTEGS